MADTDDAPGAAAEPVDDDASPESTSGAIGGKWPILVRILVGLAGFAALGLGTAIAWRSTSATTLLVVAVVLIVFAALGFDWQKIRGTYAGWTVEVLRNVEARIDRVAAVSAAAEAAPPEDRAEVDAALRGELEAIRDEIRAIEPRARPRPPAQPLSTANVDALVNDLMATKATHTFPNTYTAELSLKTVTRSESVSCTVRPTDGEPLTAVTRRRAGMPIVGAVTFLVRYPDDFQGSGPLVPGRYDVEWYPASQPGYSPLSALLKGMVVKPIATDWFVIRDTAAATVANPAATE